MGLAVDEGRRELREDDVLRVTRPPHGMSRSTGGWIGAGLGFAGALGIGAVCLAENSNCHDDAVTALTLGLLIGGPVAGALLAGPTDEELLFQAAAAP